MPTITGGCLCGKIHYSADAEPAFVGLCHCHDCQKFTGSAFAAVIGLPKSAVTVTGALKGFTKRGDSGKPIKRLFCPDRSRCRFRRPRTGRSAHKRRSRS